MDNQNLNSEVNKENNKKSSNKALMIILIVIGSVVVVAAIWLVVFKLVFKNITTNNDNNVPKVTESTTTTTITTKSTEEVDTSKNYKEANKSEYVINYSKINTETTYDAKECGGGLDHKITINNGNLIVTNTSTSENYTIKKITDAKNIISISNLSCDSISYVALTNNGDIYYTKSYMATGASDVSKFEDLFTKLDTKYNINEIGTTYVKPTEEDYGAPIIMLLAKANDGTELAFDLDDNLYILK